MERGSRGKRRLSNTHPSTLQVTEMVSTLEATFLSSLLIPTTFKTITIWIVENDIVSLVVILTFFPKVPFSHL